MSKLTRQQFNDVKKRQKLPTKVLAEAFKLGESTVRQIKRSRSFLDYKRRFILPKRVKRSNVEANARLWLSGSILCAFILLLVVIAIIG